MNVTEANLIESVQRTYTRRLFLRCKLLPVDYLERCKLLNIETLERRRIIMDLVIFYKIFHGYTKLNPSDFINIPNERMRGYAQHLILSQFNPRNNIVQNFIFNRIVKSWNNLPKEVKLAANINEFKHKLQKTSTPQLIPDTLLRL